MSAPAQIAKTPAEEALQRHFEAVAGDLPPKTGSSAARHAAMARFGELGLPHRRIEAWKYTDLRTALRDVARPAVGSAATVEPAALDAALGGFAALDTYRAVFVNGRLDDALSSLPDTGGVMVAAIAADGSEPGDAGGRLEQESIVALNEAFVTDGLTIKAAREARLDKPLMIVSARTGESDLLVTLRHEIDLAPMSELTVLETAVSIGGTGGQSNTRVIANVGDGARLTHMKIGSLTPVVDLATWSARLGRDSTYRPLQFMPGTPLARNQSFVTFEGEGGNLDFAAGVVANGRDHIDTTVVVEHMAPGCRSRELFKAVLDGQARAVSQGKVVVDRLAQKTDGKQMAQALMLSEDAEFDSKPELEIYADDVACGHGSTSARIDPEHVFYLRSRGIPQADAEALLTEAFIAEVFDVIDDEAIRDVVVQLARDWLAANASQ